MQARARWPVDRGRRSVVDVVTSRTSRDQTSDRERERERESESAHSIAARFETSCGHVRCASRRRTVVGVWSLAAFRGQSLRVTFLLRDAIFRALRPRDAIARMSAASHACRTCRLRRSACHTSTTRTTCCGHPREDVTRMLRGKLLPWNLSFKHICRRACVRVCVCVCHTAVLY